MNKTHAVAGIRHKQGLARRDDAANSLMLKCIEEWKDAYREEHPLSDPTDQELDAYIDGENEALEMATVSLLGKVERKLGFHWKAGREMWNVPNNLVLGRIS